MTEIVRIGNAQAFWGDRGGAAAEILAREPDLDFLTLDYLAEVSMSIMALQRDRDSEAGYARDLVEVVRSLAGYWSAGGRCRLITNAGGLNPRGCAEACKHALESAGCRSLKIGIVSGDDVLEVVRAGANDSSASGFRNLDTGAAISDVADRLVTANAYLGAMPVASALTGGADIVITGRLADPSLVVAACMHRFGWAEDNCDRLAGATVAGHLIECGTQVTGGISTDWFDVPDPAHIGFPIVEVAGDGSCVVTKPGGTGGCVTGMTVREQLVYEIGDPAEYLSPDVTVSFLSLQVEEVGENRVRVAGASGGPRPGTYKVSATIRDGFGAAGTLTVVGRDAEEKARLCGEVVLQRVREAGFTLHESVIECLGSGDAAAGIIPTGETRPGDFAETVLRIAVEAGSREAVECFARELMPLITAGPQGTTGYAAGRPRVRPVFGYWPCLIGRDLVTPVVEVIETAQQGDTTAAASSWGKLPACRFDGDTSPKLAASATKTADRRQPATLYEIAVARSGDKGTGANVGVIARNAQAWPFLQSWLTVERVAEFLAPLAPDAVERFELPNLQALNFVLRGALKSRLRTDVQGKALGQILLEMPLPAGAVRTIGRDD